MAISVFDLFSIGIGPSSSHTVGPMRAARRFAQRLAEAGCLDQVSGIRTELFGSLALTGRGHGTDRAVIVGLEGAIPEEIDPETLEARVGAVRRHGRLLVLGQHPIVFRDPEHLIFHNQRTMPFHSNGMRFTAVDHAGATVLTRVFYSIGGGFVVDETAAGGDVLVADQTALPYHFRSGDEMLEMAQAAELRLSDLMLANERCWRDEEAIRSGVLHLWKVMQACVRRGCERPDPTLPGKLHVRRRAPEMHRRLTTQGDPDPLTILDWVNVWALAVNEENASGGRVVTAPTNGAAGILPAVLHYYCRFIDGANEDGVIRFLLAAGAIGILFKENASISGAEAGCQGEVGVACSMAAAGLTEALGGTVLQVEQAAEIGMEHNLGLTCDPVGGLVQIPCIERNAMGAVKAINASRLARRGDGTHRVSLDKVIKTMRETGEDMQHKYKETSRGGLAVNVIEC